MKLSLQEEKKLIRLAKMVDSKEVATLEEFDALDSKVEELSNKLDENVLVTQDAIESISEELKKKLESELVLEIDREELKGDKGDKGDKGEKGDTTIVEKIIERTEVIKEQPIVTEIIKNIENPFILDGEAVVEKINLADTKIKAERVDGLVGKEEVATLQNRTQLLNQIASGIDRRVTALEANPSGGTDEKVKLNASDPTAGYLDAKLNEGVTGVKAVDSSGFHIKGSGGDTAVLVGAGGGKNVTFYDGVKLDTATPSKVVFTDANKNLTNTGIGTSAQFIKGDGSLDSSAYLTAEADTLQTVTDRGATTTNAVTFNISTPAGNPIPVIDLFSGGGTAGASEFGTGLTSGFYKGSVALNNGRVFYMLVGDTATRSIFGAAIDNDAYRRFRILTTGQQEWGPGNAAPDTNLYRSGANALKTDDAFSCAGLTSTAGVAAGGAITGATTLNTLSSGIFGLTGATANSGVDITGTRPTIITTFTGVTSKARTGNMGTGAQNFFTMNASFDGANWNSDDTSLPVVVFDVSTANPGMRLRYAAAGVGAKTLLTAMQMSTAGVMQIPKLSPIADSTTAMQFFKADGTTAVMTIDTTNSRLGVGVTPSAKIHALATTEQLRLGYDASNYLSATVASTGSTTFALTGTTPTFTFSQKIIHGAPTNLKNYTVATLPTGVRGDVAYVTDALAPAFLVAIVGGGAVVAPVFYDGTNWVAY
jgi:hypothetical protein